MSVLSMLKKQIEEKDHQLKLNLAELYVKLQNKDLPQDERAKILDGVSKIKAELEDEIAELKRK